MWPFDHKTRKRVLVRFKLSEAGQRDAEKRGYCDNPLQYRVVRIPWRYDHLIMDYDRLPYVPFCAIQFDEFPTTEAILDAIGNKHGYRGGELDVSERLVAHATVDVHGCYAHGKGYRPTEDGWYWFDDYKAPVLVKGDTMYSLIVDGDRCVVNRVNSRRIKETKNSSWMGELDGPASQMTIKKGA